MRLLTISGRHSWKVLAGTARSQAAEMVIAPGKSEGGSGNRHPRSDQWLFVTSGRGVAILKNKKVILKKNSLLLIEKGEAHEIRNIARKPLKTINFYSPPTY